jgi:argininosuccinate synthase
MRLSMSRRKPSPAVRLKLFKGQATLAGVKSPKSLYNPHLASFTMGAEYNSTDATGFIRLFGLPMKVFGAVQRQGKK